MQDGFRKPEPISAVGRRYDRDLAERLQPGAESIARKCRISVAPERGGVLGNLARFGLDLSLELHRRIGQIIAPKRLLGGGRQGK